MEKLWFSPVWSQVFLMQLTLPKVPTDGVQVLLREAISLPINSYWSDFSRCFFSLIAPYCISRWNGRGSSDLSQTQLKSSLRSVLWLNFPAGHQVAKLPVLCVSLWKFSTLAAQKDICFIKKGFSYLQWIIIHSTNKIFFSIKAVLNKAEHGLGFWFPEISQYKQISTSENKRKTFISLTFKNLLDIKYIDQAEIWVGLSSCLEKHFLIWMLKHAIFPI